MSPRSASPRTRTRVSTSTSACARLDELAARCPAPTFDALRVAPLRARGFAGNLDHYGDPENSFLDSVLERRRGIPISLSVADDRGRPPPRRRRARRRACPATSSCSTASAATCGAIPFHGGALHDADGCRRRFDMVYGGALRVPARFLAPTPPHAIVARMLANLERGELASDPVQRGVDVRAAPRDPGHRVPGAARARRPARRDR